MKNFPSKFNPENKDSFKVYSYERNLCYLRKEIYEYLLSNPTDWFDLEDFNKRYVKNAQTTLEISKEIVKELEALGWRVKYLFGSTALAFEDNIPLGEEI